VDYRLHLGGAPTLRYADLQRFFEQSGNELSLAEVAAVVRRVRQAKGMLLVEGDPDCRSAGSFFKNPVVSEELAGRIAAVSEKEMPRFPAGPGQVKVPAAWLIEQAGFAKGYAAGAAGVSSRHTLALVIEGALLPPRFWRWRRRSWLRLTRDLGFDWRGSRFWWGSDLC